MTFSDDIRANTAKMIAEAAIDGRPLSVCTYAAALELGIDAEAIESNPQFFLDNAQEATNHG
jgi:hypothetical protein